MRDDGIQLDLIKYLTSEKFVGQYFSSVKVTKYLKSFVTFNRRDIFNKISDKKKVF